MDIVVTFDDGVEIELHGVEMIVQGVTVMLDSDGDIEQVYAGKTELLAYSHLPEIRALHTAICRTLDQGIYKTTLEDAYAEWLADEPNRAADYAYERRY